MSNTYRFVRGVSLLAVGLLCGCDSGAGAGGAGSGDGLSVSPASITFSAVAGAAPPAQTVEIAVTAPDADQVAVGYPPPATSEPSWLALDLGCLGSACQLGLSIRDAGLAPGTYSATVRVAILRVELTVIGHRDVSVTFTVAAGISVTRAVTLQQTFGSSQRAAAKLLSVGGTSGLLFTASADQPWVTLSAASGTVPQMIQVGVEPSGLAPGVYTAVVTVLGGPAPATTDVTLTVAAPVLTLNRTAIPLTGTAGKAPASTLTAALSLDTGTRAYPWSVTSAPHWLDVTPSSGNVAASGASLTFSARTTTLPPGTHAGTVTFSASLAGLVVTRTVPVTCTLSAPRLTVPPSAMLGGAGGHDLSAQTILLQLDTGANPFDWTATTAAGWASVTSGGTVSATSASVTVSPDLDAIALLGAGTYTSTIEVAVLLNGAPVTASIPLTLTLDDHVLLTSEDGVALTKLPDAGALTRSVTIRSNRGVATDWSASSDQPWLDVTPSGTTGGALLLTADPTALAADALYEATVTVSSSDPTIAGPRTVHVGLWIGSAAPADVTLPLDLWQMTADPVRPYLYAHTHGTDVTVFNVFTGEVVRTLSAVGTKLGAMEVSDDGSTLFVVDDTALTIVPLNLATDAVGAGWPIAPGVTYVFLAHARPNGASVLLASDGVVRDARTGATLGSTFSSDGSVLAAARGGRLFCVASPVCHSLDFTSEGNRILVGPPRFGSGGGGSNPQDVALSADGARVYQASGWPYVFSVFDASAAAGAMTALPTLAGDAYPVAVEVDPDGRLFGGASSANGTTDVWAYDAAGTLLATYDVAWTSRVLKNRQIAISGDGLRVMVLTSDPSLEFLSTPP